MQADKTSGYSVLLRNLRYTTTTQAVRDAFEQFGEIRDVYLPLDFATKRPRGFGFVEFSVEEDAIAAVKAMDNKEFDGSVITCCLAQDRRKSPNSMRRAYHNAAPSRRMDHYSRYRSRSRSPGARYARRSYSYERRHPPPREEHQYYHRRDYDRSPSRYSRPYGYERDYRDHRDHRDHRSDYMEHEGRRYVDRSYPREYPRHMHERRKSPLGSHESHRMEAVPGEPHDGRVRRPVRKNP